MKEPSRVGWSARGTVARTVGAGIVNAAGRGLSRPGTGRQGRRNRVVTAGNPSLLTSHHVTSECAFLRGSSLDPPEHEPCQSRRISGGGAWADPILCRSPHLSRRGGWPARRFRQCAVPSGRQHRGDAAHCDVSRRSQSGQLPPGGRTRHGWPGAPDESSTRDLSRQRRVSRDITDARKRLIQPTFAVARCSSVSSPEIVSGCPVA